MLFFNKMLIIVQLFLKLKSFGMHLCYNEKRPLEGVAHDTKNYI
jgi:hypothetical protein